METAPLIASMTALKIPPRLPPVIAVVVFLKATASKLVATSPVVGGAGVMASVSLVTVLAEDASNVVALDDLFSPLHMI